MNNIKKTRYCSSIWGKQFFLSDMEQDFLWWSDQDPVKLGPDPKIRRKKIFYLLLSKALTSLGFRNEHKAVISLFMVNYNKCSNNVLLENSKVFPLLGRF